MSNDGTKSTYIKSIAVTYTTGGGQQTVVAPTFDPESGATFEESLSVKITPAENTTMYYTTDGSAPSSSTGTGYTTEQTVNLTATTTIKAIAYDGSNNASSVAEATYTKETFENIEDITNDNNNHYVRGTVVAINSRGFVLADNTDNVYVYLYNSNNNPNPTIPALNSNRKVNGKLTTYGKVLEYNYQATVSEAQSSNYAGRTPTTIDGDDMKAVIDGSTNYLSAYQQFEGRLTKDDNNNYNISVSGDNNDATARISYPTSDQTTTLNGLLNKTVMVQGYFTGISSSTYTVMLSSIEEVVNTDPTIEASAGSSLAYNAGSGSIAYEINNYVAGTMTANTTATWISNFVVTPDAQDNSLGEVTFDVANNTAYENRSATVTLTYTYGRATVSKNVTVTQLSAPNIVVTPATATVAADGDLPEFGITYASLAITDEDDFAVEFFESNGTTTTIQPTWISAYEINPGTTDYVLTVAVEENTDAQRMAYLKVFAFNGNDVVYSNLITITQSAPAQTTIDLRGTTAAISFSPGAFTASGTGYQSYTNVTYTGSNNVEYSGWTLTNVMHSGDNMQMKKSGDGKVEMPAILTDYGCTIAVTTVTNSVSVNNGEESGTNSLTTTSTSVYATIATGSDYAVISTITITPTPAPANYDLTVSLNTHINGIYVFNAADETNPLIADGAAGTTQVLGGTTIHVSPDVENGYLLQSLSVKDANDNDVQTTYVSEGEYYSFIMPASNVTITATAVEAPVMTDYQLFSGNLCEGDYIIYYNGYALKNEKLGTSDRLSYETVEPDDYDVITTDDVTIVWHIAPSATEGYWTIYNVSENKFAASTGADNKAQLLASGTDDKSLWAVSGTYEFVNKYNTANNKNANLRNNGANGFACYNPNNVGGALSLYKKVEPTYTLAINGYGDSETTGWNLIASPVDGSVKATTVQNLVGKQIPNSDPVVYDFDLYRFNQTGANGEWENYHQHNATNEPFMLENGKGYLFARKAGATLTFYGQPYDGNTKEVTLSSGWNLIGNPFNANATLNRDFYAMNETGSEISVQGSTTTTIGAMTGVFVQANQANETATFTKKVTEGASNNNSSSININLTNTSSRSASVIDRAIVRFNGNALPKFQLFENSTKLYFPQNGEDFAIVSAEPQGEMPVNFKANEDGQYTITVNPEDVEMTYLHLIDNIAGKDIDLLATPSYTFNAKSDDYASRFRLVFSANNANSENDNVDFAFISNGQIIVNGTGTVQVIDMLGRQVHSSQANSEIRISNSELTPGGYVLRLIDGSNVKSQKIVVR